MLTPTHDKPATPSRQDTADAVHEAMTRFPLILNILGELAKSQIPLPGDADIRHGCQRGLSSILVSLSRINPAPPGPATKHEQTALNWLHSREAAELIDADQLERFQHFFARILSPPAQHH